MYVDSQTADAQITFLDVQYCVVTLYIDDLDSSERVYYQTFSGSTEEEGDFYEGDMILPEGETKNHISNLVRRWPNGVLPYVIDGSFSE